MVHRRPGSGLSRGASLLALIAGILAAVLATVVFLIDVIFVAVVRHRVRSESDGALTLTWGNAVSTACHDAFHFKSIEDPVLTC